MVEVVKQSKILEIYIYIYIPLIDTVAQPRDGRSASSRDRAIRDRIGEQIVMSNAGLVLSSIISARGGGECFLDLFLGGR